MVQKLSSANFIQDEMGRGLRPNAVATAADPSRVYVPITLGSTALVNGACRNINAETAGRVKLTQDDGTVRDNYPLTAGYNAIVATVIDVPGSGTPATGVWAIY